MFDLFSSQHIFILLIVLLVVVGPKDLPRLMRIIGQWTGKARAMANEFRKSFDDMARQAELDELRKEIENLKNERPLAGMESELNAIIPDDLKSAPLTAAKEPPTVSLEPEPVASEVAAAIPVEIETSPHIIDDPAIPEPVEPVAADGYTPPKP